MVKPRFYDLNVHSTPEGKSSPQQLSELARHFGYSGIALTNHSNAEGNYQASKCDDFEVFKGIELVASNPSKLHGLIGKYRKKVDVLIVHGGSESINRAAVENSNVDILAHPQTSKDSGLNHVLAKSASANNVAIEFNLDAIIRGRGGRRVHSISHFRKNLAIARKYDVSMILTSNAHSYFDLRAPREMIAIAGLFGMTEEEAISALSKTPAEVISRNRPSTGFVQNGVEVIREDILCDEGEFL